MKLTVVMPVYNEQETIDQIIARVRAVDLPLELILVDDCSTDSTRRRLRQYANESDVRVLEHRQNQGKGAALRTGFPAATGDAVVVQDADLEYDPQVFPELIEPIAAGRADVVYGTRFRAEGFQRGRWANYLANRVLTILSNLFTGLRLTDMETCYKVFRREVIQDIRIEEDRFGFEPEITAKIAERGCRIVEVPVSYAPRKHEEGKKIGLRDGLRAIWCIAKYNLRWRLGRRKGRGR